MSSLDSFNPDAKALKESGIYGLPCNESESKVVVIPVPWEATTSYGSGASLGPAAIFEASKQQDLYQYDMPDIWRSGIFMREIPQNVVELNKFNKSLAQSVINEAVSGQEALHIIESVNEASETLNKFVENEVSEVYSSDKIPVVLGGDHSVPYGAFVATGNHFGDFGILHFDAHADLRESYMGFKYSHASIMFNAIQIPQVTKLVQVGIRDFGYKEMEVIKNNGKIMSFFDGHMKGALLSGATFDEIADQIIGNLPGNVWVSFDIDGLDPSLCPNTGTPVLGGLSFDQVNRIFSILVKSGRRILGCDLNEVAPASDGSNDWDANVGMRLLYRMIGFTLNSQNREANR